MKFSDLVDHLKTINPPYVMAIESWDREIFFNALEREAASEAIYRIDGRLMKTKEEAFFQFASCLDFPKKDVINWAQFEEYMRDLSWLPSKNIVILIDYGDGSFPRDKKGLATFVESLKFVASEWAVPVKEGEWWDRPAIPFHTLFLVRPGSRFPVETTRIRQ